MTLSVPRTSLILLIGPSGCGKSTFARKHFKPTETISSDFCRALVSDDEDDQSASADAFALLHDIAGKRLRRGRLTVIDATNVQRRARASLLKLARQYDVPAVAIVLNLSEKICLAHDRARPRRHVGLAVIRKQAQDLRESLPKLEQEGFLRIYVLESAEDVENAVIQRRTLPRD